MLVVMVPMAAHKGGKVSGALSLGGPMEICRLEGPFIGPFQAPAISVGGPNGANNFFGEFIWNNVNGTGRGIHRKDNIVIVIYVICYHLLLQLLLSVNELSL